MKSKTSFLPLHRLLVSILLSAVAVWAPAGPVFGEIVTLNARSRVTAADDPVGFEIVNNELKWETTKTAVIVCDMWDAHWCKGATARVGELVVAMNDFLNGARAKGMLIIHSPSGTVNYYANHPARKRATEAPKAANLPQGIDAWCNWISDIEKAAYPIDQSDGGCDCQPRCPGGSPWRKEIEGLTIGAEDAISDSGPEIWNLMEARGIDNVMLVGVHTNMCVLGRPFGLRNMARNGKNVLLVRDLTDTMYNSQMAPKVNHFTGTDLIVEHIETYVCPTIVSSEITGKDPFRFKDDKRKRLAFLIAENEYRSNQTLPEFARKLQLRYDFACDFCIGLAKATGPERHNIAGMETLKNADLAVIYVRRRALPAEQMKYLQDYLATGKGLIGIRTACHAFDAKGTAPAGLLEWKAFDPEVLGGNYHGHYGHLPEGTDVEIAAATASHPALAGVKGFNSPSWLYEVMPLAATTQVLLTGTIDGKPSEPVAWVNTYKDNRVFFTSLGHWDDWKIDSFDRLMINAVFWTMRMPIPAEE